MIKIAFATIVLVGSLTATTALAEDTDCLTANAERPDRDAYCFKQAQDAALQATKDKLNQDFQNGLKKNKPQPAEPGGAVPDQSTANPTTGTGTAPGTGTTTATGTAPGPASAPPQNEAPTTNSTTNATPTEQTVNPGSDTTLPGTKPVLPKPKTHPPIQYY